MSDDIGTKGKRVRFLKAIGQSLSSHYGVILDVVALYSADNAAVPELLKLGSLLQAAHKVQPNKETFSFHSVISQALPAKTQGASCRQAAAEGCHSPIPGWTRKIQAPKLSCINQHQNLF